MIQRSRPAERTGFTFVELLMVIAIIAVMAALLLSGISKVMALQARTEVMSDITQMAQSLEQSKAAYNHAEHLPSCIVLHNDKRKYRDISLVANSFAPGRPNVAYRALTSRSMAVLQAMFGRRVFQGRKQPSDPTYNAATHELLNWDGTGNLNNSTVLTGSECLVFYLGGMPDRTAGAAKCIGFSKDPLDPTLPGGSDRIGPFFPFKSSRLVLHDASRTFYEYWDAYTPRANVPRQPYAYYGAFSANNYAPTDVYRTDLSNSNVTSATYTNTDNNHLTPTSPPGPTRNAYYEVATSGASTKWLYPNKYQIISAGRDQLFGDGWALNVAEGSIDFATKDNLANFSSTELGNTVE